MRPWMTEGWKRLSSGERDQGGTSVWSSANRFVG